uniref:uncharacterized protein LOC101296587 n=1 Tax=Fragaria vesca subsp. vesca TaxID=101020 RepID=UPI0005C87225|nr:PREDICTED: uncharacterized protein LOC101296587 [Fragaria vesca subsp. vesca]
MALRCFLGKMRIANKFLHSKERIMMLGTSEVFKHKNKELLSIAFPTLSSPRHFRDTENRAPTPIATKKEVLDNHMNIGGIRPARFALEEFNTIKKTQLQLVRVVGFWMKPQGYPHNPCHCLYVVIMKAVDADGVARLYQARVQLHESTEGMFLEAFYHCSTDPDSAKYNRHYKRLYHFLDNFCDIMYKGVEYW